MVELSINQSVLDMPKKGSSIKYTRQIADVFDLAAVSNSFTNSFSVPKTSNNTKILQQLGIVGDVSSIPYSKVAAQLSDGGISIIPFGWLNVKETSESYKLNIIDGTINFFKDIENKNMGLDINLSDFDHEKNIETVIASFSNDFYKYIVADYNGKNFAEVSGETGINIDYLVPCFNMGKLFERVMQTFGYTYSDTNIEELDDLWITYPKPPSETITASLFADLFKANYTCPIPPGPDPIGNADGYSSWTTSSLTEGTLTDNWIYNVPESGVYRLDNVVEAYAFYRRRFAGGGVELLYKPAQFNVLVNGVLVYVFDTDPFAPITNTRSVYLSEGDSIKIRITADKGSDFTELIYIKHNSTSFKIYRTNQGNVLLNDAFKNFKIKDFIKECFWYCAVTPQLDAIENHMTFISLSERLDFKNAVDMSRYYVKRNSETYNNGLAQKNAFRHQYNDPKDKYQDGYLYSNNKNSADEKILVASKIYAPENINTLFADTEGGNSFTTKKFKVWERESKEAADGNISVEYKGLNERFYYMKMKQSEVSEWLFVSEAVIGTDTVDQIPYADTKGTTFDQIVPNKWGLYAGVLDNFKCHDIDFALGLMDFLNFDLTKPIFVEQESSYYLVNKVDYATGNLSGAECIRITIPEFLPLDNVSIQAQATTAYGIRFKMPVIEGFNNIITDDSYVKVNDNADASLVGETADDNYITIYATISVPDYEPEPTIREVYFKVTNGETNREYKFMTPGVTFTTSDQVAGTTKTLIATAQNI